MLSVKQVAAQAGVTIETVRAWCRMGMIDGAELQDILCANGKTRRAWKIPERWKIRRETDGGKIISEGMRIAREREKETAGNCPKWVPGQSDPVAYVWRNSSAKSVRSLAEEMGVSCGMVTRFYDMAMARYVG